jgi:hypothetical protein
MPFGDKKGPLGEGPKTGRARGYCGGFGRPGRFDPAPGLGLGRGSRGQGKRLRNRGGNPSATPATVAPADAQQEVVELKAGLDSLLTSVNQLRQRLDEIQSAPRNAEHSAERNA